jgi:pyruvate dehydrogenase E2 component (dihydrolipoamide acetyltransferase)
MGRIVEMPLPRLGETMDEGRIGLIVKKPGEKFRRGETLLEVESDKTTVEVPALQDGILVEWLVASDDMVPVESAIARIEIEGEPVAQAKRAPVQPPARRGQGPATTVTRAPGFRRDDGPGLRPRASTAARAAARRSGIDIASLQGSGRNGRVMSADLEAARRPARAAYHTTTPLGKIFFREWPAQGQPKGSALLVHGLFADSQSFTTLGRKLAAEGLRTYAFDLPGHGQTQSSAANLPDIAGDVLAALPPGRFRIVGHSFGAVIATLLGERAQSLTLLAPGGTGEEINGAFLSSMLKGDIDAALRHLGETIPAEAIAATAQAVSANAAQLRAIIAEIAEDGRQRGSILSKLAALSIPVQAVFLRDDAVIPAHHALNMPFNVNVHIMPGASHLPHWRDPDGIAALVSRLQ